MSCEDFTQYRTFLNTFASSPDEIWNVRFGSYTIDDSETVAEAINWTLQYLIEGQCPTSLVTPIIENIASEILNKDRKTETKDEFDFRSGNYKAGEVKRLVFELLKKYCSKLSDNVELNKVLALTAGKNDDYPSIYSVASTKNSRRTMEDRYICIEDFNRVFNVQNANQKVHLYAVFDGHNGHNAAYYGASHLPFNIANDPAYSSNPIEALRRAFITTDRNFVKKNIKSGTTALCALHYPQESKLLVAWVGDSKALLVKKKSILQLVIPHKPNIKEEADRIIKQGGSIMTWGGTLRVKGLLNLSRALGDVSCKPFVISDPDIKCIELDNEEDFLILASDGLWDHLCEEDAALAVYNYVKQEKDKDSVANHLIELAKNSGSTDNITVIVVFLKKPSLIKSFNNSTVGAAETTKTEPTTVTETTKMDMDTFDNRYSSDVNLDNTQTLVPNANTEIDIKTGPGKDIFQNDSLFNDGLNNLVDPSVPTSNNDTNNPFTTATTKNFDTTNDIIEDKNNIDLLSSFTGGETEYHQNNHHHHDDNEFLHDHHHQNIIDSPKLNNDDNKILSSFENDMGPETSVDITDDVMMMATENSETTDLLEQSALSQSKETLPSSDNMNPFDIKCSLQDFGGNTTEEVPNIEEASTRTPTSPFDDFSPIPPPTEGIIITDDDHHQNLIINDDNGVGDVTVDEDDEIGMLTNKFDSMIVNDIKENEQLLFDDEEDKDVAEKQILENPENPSYIQNDEEQIKKNDEHLIEHFDEINSEKKLIENNKYYDDNHHYNDDDMDKENVCDKENEYLVDDDYKIDDNRLTESEIGTVPVTSLQDTLVHEQFENISTETKQESFGINEIADNEIHENQNAFAEGIHSDENFSNQQEEIDKFNLDNKENVEFSNEQFIPDQLQQNLELQQEQEHHQIQNQQQEEYQQSQEISVETHIEEHNLLTDDMKAGNLKNEEDKISENLITGTESCDESEDEWKYMQLKEGEGEKNTIIRNDNEEHSLLEASTTEEIYFQQEETISDNFEEFEGNLIEEKQPIKEEVFAVEVISPVPPSLQSAVDSILEESNKSEEFEIKEEKTCEDEEELNLPQSKQQLSAAIISSPTEFLSEVENKHEKIPAVAYHQEIDVEEQQQVTEEIDDMSTKLNPDAKEFVPSQSLSSSNPLSDDNDNDDLNVTNGSDIIVDESTPAPVSDDVTDEAVTEVEAKHAIIAPLNGSPLVLGAAKQHHLPSDDIIAQSPRKGAITMENIHLPDETEFHTEIHHRPSEASPLSSDSPCPINADEMVARDLMNDDVMNLKETMHADEKEAEQATSSPISMEEEQCVMKLMENADMKKSIYVENEEERMNEINKLLSQNLSLTSSVNNQIQLETVRLTGGEERDAIKDRSSPLPPPVENVAETATATSETTALTVAAAAVAAVATVATVATSPTPTAKTETVQAKKLKIKVPADGKKTTPGKASPTKKTHTPTSKVLTTKSGATVTSRPGTSRPETSRPSPAAPRPQTARPLATKSTAKPKVDTAITIARTGKTTAAPTTTTAATTTKRQVPVEKTTKSANDPAKPATTSLSPVSKNTAITNRPKPGVPTKSLPVNKAPTANKGTTVTSSKPKVYNRTTVTATKPGTTRLTAGAGGSSSTTLRKTDLQKCPATTRLRPVTTSSATSTLPMPTTKNPPPKTGRTVYRNSTSTNTLARPATAPASSSAAKLKSDKTSNSKEIKVIKKPPVKSSISTTSISVSSFVADTATNGSAEPKLNGSPIRDTKDT